MANYLCMFSAPVAHIEFMHRHPDTARDYYVGEPPDIEALAPKKPSVFRRLLGRGSASQQQEPVTIPADWPQADADVIDIEINHRNVDLYHWILNGTDKPVEGPGSIFQTWFARTHSAIALDDYNEDFAFMPEQLPGLLELVQQVTPESLRSAFRDWCVANGKDHEPDIEEAVEMHQGFVHFAEYLQKAIEKGHGLVWVVS